jgi:hypothetical protein
MQSSHSVFVPLCTLLSLGTRSARCRAAALRPPSREQQRWPMDHGGAISGTLAHSLRSYLAPMYRIAFPSLPRLPEIDLLPTLLVQD